MGLMNMGFPRTQATKNLIKRTVPVVTKSTPIAMPVPPLTLNLTPTSAIMTQVPMQSAPPLAQTPTQPPSYAPLLDLSNAVNSPGLLPQYTPPGQAPMEMPFPQPAIVNHTAIAAFGGVGLLVVGVGLYLVMKRK